MVDAGGRVAVHTGARCIADAGHIPGKASLFSQYDAQSNHLAGMAEAYPRLAGRPGPSACWQLWMQVKAAGWRYSRPASACILM